MLNWCALSLKLVLSILLHVDLPPASPLTCLQGPELLGLTCHAQKVGANGDVMHFIAGCLLEVSFPAYCLQSISVQLSTYHCFLSSLLLGL